MGIYLYYITYICYYLMNIEMVNVTMILIKCVKYNRAFTNYLRLKIKITNKSEY